MESNKEKEIMLPISQIIKTEMQNRKLTLQFVATYLDIGIATMDRRLREQNDFWYSELYKLAMLFKIPISQLINKFHNNSSEQGNIIEDESNLEKISLYAQNNDYSSYFHRISQLEEENKSLKMENESLKKEISYLLRSLEDKSKIISLLEKNTHS